MAKLPYDLRKRWVKKSVQIENTLGYLANFLHLVEFVCAESVEMNSLFGLRSLNPKNPSSKPKVKTKASLFGAVTSRSTTIAESEPKVPLSCWFCKDSTHKIFDCKEFKGKSVQDRISFIKESKSCHKCLSPNHRTPDCKGNKPCSVPGCKGLFHHTLLHLYRNIKDKPRDQNLHPSSSSEASAVPVTCGFTKSESSGQQEDLHVYLCIVPVKVANGDKVVSTYAFLDQGSTHSF